MTTLFVLEVKGLGDREEEFTFCGVFSQQALAEAYVRDMSEYEAEDYKPDYLIIKTELDRKF